MMETERRSRPGNRQLSMQILVESERARCAWKVLNLYLTQAVPYDDAKAGAAVAVQSFGDFQNFNSHLHVICTDGCFYGNGSFKACPTPQAKDLEEPFRHEENLGSKLE